MALRQPPKPKRDRSDEFASFVPPRPRVGVMRLIEDGAARIRADIQAGMHLAGVPPKVTRKQRTRMDLRASANGEQCLMALPGCTGAAILSHNKHLHAGKAKGLKAPCINSAYACTHCDAIYDGQIRLPGWSRDMIELAWYRAHDQTLLKFLQKGLV